MPATIEYAMYNRPVTTKSGQQTSAASPVSSNSRGKVCSCAVAVKSTAVVLQPSQGVPPVEPGCKLLGVALNGQVTILQNAPVTYYVKSNGSGLLLLSISVLCLCQVCIIALVFMTMVLTTLARRYNLVGMT